MAHKISGVERAVALTGRVDAPQAGDEFVEHGFGQGRPQRGGLDSVEQEILGEEQAIHAGFCSLVVVSRRMTMAPSLPSAAGL
ncbi:hypothetical protein [Immundisolibacter cernigliae]|uniref:hypothetical protein n=1 Tax=Immundisolibacter cernigliae TaxID=1810504 RepID=UPI0011AB5FDF|nr:hypothetical protein [Immundisolibacter cernigliae]